MNKQRNKKGQYIKMAESKNKRIRVTDDEYRDILVHRFLNQVDECQENNWRNSDLWEETEKNLELIAEHLKKCSNCHQDFGIWLEDKKPSFALIDLGDFPQNLHDWICEK